MTTSFSATVDRWTAATRERIEAVKKQSAQEVIEMAQLPVAKGGRMRVDTGFLRASGKTSLENPGGGVEDNPFTEPNSVQWADDVALTIAGARGDQSIYFTWSASYARVRESYDGFLANAAANWKAIVRRNVARLRRRAR